MNPHAIINARKEHIPVIANLLARAFADDPIMMWTFKRPDILEAVLRVLIKDIYLPNGHVRLGETQESAALWMPSHIKPKPNHLTSLRYMFAILSRGAVQPIERGEIVSSHLRRFRPKEIPYTYLFLIGVNPDQKGKGLGGKILLDGIERAEKENTALYLETSKVDLIPFYEKFGFHVCEEVELAPNAPKIWTMLRD